MKHLTILSACILALGVEAQIINTGVMDTTDFRYQGKLTVEGYFDGYYCYDFNDPDSGNKPYAVSMSRHNEMTVNLAFVDLKYSSSRLRARIVPGFGTYINANYQSEPGALKFLVEASGGVKLSKARSVWLDFGVFGSPYTNESAISKDHLAYTRSFAPEFVPYYLSGLKLSAVVSPKVNAFLYLVNGWQQIQDNNAGKSIGTQLEYRPNDHWLINWNTYLGSEKSEMNPAFRTRYFTDAFFIFSKGKWTATGCAYIGLQERESSSNASWWQANIIGRYDLTNKLSVTGRLEYFEDPDNVVATPLNGPYFSSFSTSLGLNQKPAENVLIRFEYRAYYSANDVFEKGSSFGDNSGVATANLTLWF